MPTIVDDIRFNAIRFNGSRWLLFDCSLRPATLASWLDGFNFSKHCLSLPLCATIITVSDV